MINIQAKALAIHLPKRLPESHKGSFGNVAIIGGDTGMVGAALLAARAALYLGAGRIYVSFLAENAPSVDSIHPEIMCRSIHALSSITVDALVIGPGLGNSNFALQLLSQWLQTKLTLVLDADALNLIAQHQALQIDVQNRDAITVMTPHPAEAARLLGSSTEVVQADREQACLNIAKQFNCIALLKGNNTLCASHNGDIVINHTGNVGLASGGTGDVLSGVIGALLAQKLSAFEAAQLGVYLHGLAADKLVERGIGPAGLTASELIPEIRYQFNQLYRTYHASNH